MKKMGMAFIVVLVGVYGVLIWSDTPPESSGSSVSLIARQASLSVPLPIQRAVETLANAIPQEANAPRLRAAEIAQAYLEAHRETWGIQAHHQMKPEVAQSPLGSVVQFSVYQDEIPILGMGIEMRLGWNGEILEVKSQYRPVSAVDVNQPVVSPEAFLAGASGRFEAAAGSGPASSVIYLPPGDGEPIMAIAMMVHRTGHPEQSVQAVFRASDGQLLGLSSARAEFR
jgi:hypothetical protein